MKNRKKLLFALLLSCSFLWGCASSPQGVDSPAESEAPIVPATELVAPEGMGYSEIKALVENTENLIGIELPDTALSREELDELREAHPYLPIRYSFTLGEAEYDGSESTLSLPAPGTLTMEGLIEKLRLFDAPETVEVDGGYSVEEVIALQEAFPDTVFAYRFELFGQTVSTTDERIEFVENMALKEGVEELYRVMPCLKGCSYFLIDSCGLDYETEDALKQAFPERNVVFRVSIAGMNWLTDVKVIHMTWGINDFTCTPLQYCTELEFLDVGHNGLYHVEFASKLKKLKLLILSFNPLVDISPLAECENLEVVEFYRCFTLPDCKALASCKKLRQVNISWTGIRDLSPLYELPDLQRCYCIANAIPEAQQEEVRAAMPEVWLTFEQKVWRNVGWSYDAKEVRAQWYLDMAKVLKLRVEDWYYGDLPEGFEDWHAPA